MSDEAHISSLVVHVRPECCADAATLIGAMEGAEISGINPSGKMVVVLETATAADILAQMAAINDIPGIITASLIYHEIDANSEEDQ